MTEIIKVTACCAEDMEVVFAVGNNISVLSNGQSTEKALYYANDVATTYERLKGSKGRPTNPSKGNLV